MEIKELGKNLEKKLGKNGVYLLVGGAVLFGLYNLVKSSDDGESSELVNAVAYASYPDAVTNANTIIGQVNDHTTTEIGNLQDNLDEKLDKIDTGNEQIQEKVDQIGETTKDTASSVGTIGGKVNTIEKLIPTIPTNFTTTNKYKDYDSKQTTTTTTTKKTSYYKKTSIKNGSIVDSLKSAGINSSFSNRKKIAKANGIKNYTGSASQNMKLMNLLKAGKLKKA